MSDEDEVYKNENDNYELILLLVYVVSIHSLHRKILFHVCCIYVMYV